MGYIAKAGLIKVKKYIFLLVFLIAVAAVIFALQGNKEDDRNDENGVPDMRIDFIDKREDLYKTAVFAGGCFWCIEYAFEHQEGIIDAVSGYTGGEMSNPTYYDVLSGKTGHYEAVMVTYNPLRISYLDLLELFFRQIDPTDPGGQFADRGTQYMTAIFFQDARQQNAAARYISILEQLKIFDGDIVTKLLPRMEFFPAEERHQNYSRKNETDYDAYAWGSGRRSFISSTWSGTDTITGIIGGREYSGADDTELKNILTPLQYEVTQMKGTERPFDNLYYDNHRDGIYVDIVSGEPLFSSTHKYDSGSGWPSFSIPVAPANIRYATDASIYPERVEVLSRYAGSHLGHVFTDGPTETGLRYCINSASLRFVSKDDMEKEGYGIYMYMFD